jgi:Spy/CpxP family protein refolding chaperone
MNCRDNLVIGMCKTKGSAYSFFRRKERIMKRTWSWFIFCVLLLVLAVPQSYAGTNPPIDSIGKGMRESCPTMVPPPPPDCIGKMVGMSEWRHLCWLQFRIQTLDLDYNQKEAFKEIENTTLKELIRKSADEGIAEIELRELLDQETIDLKAVEAKLKQIAMMKSETQFAVIKSIEKVKAKLTPEQCNQLEKVRQMNPR